MNGDFEDLQIKERKFVVTGGAGFIGSHIIDRLLDEGAREIVILDTMVRGGLHNIAHALKDPRCNHYIADIRFPHEIDQHFEDCDGCFHLSTLRITQCADEPRRALEVMVDGTFNVLEACVKHNVEKIIFSSSASVYGMADEFPTQEKHHPWNNDTLYGVTKTCGEGLLKTFKAMYGLNWVALRYFNVYGPRMDVHGKYTEVFIRWLECFERGDTPKIFGDGQQTMDFIYVEDIADANILAMKSDVEDGAFNIASGSETSLSDLLEALREAYEGETKNPDFLPERSVNPVPRRLADTQAAAEQIGFTAETSLVDGLKNLIEWRNSLVRK